MQLLPSSKVYGLNALSVQGDKVVCKTTGEIFESSNVRRVFLV
jgi:hypothetical protein